ncbi:MAG: CopG family transcriptional regulator [Aphanocapsa sp. GSE-SYN-MK-11-07L]|jgi:hypothetical protein|nr:CopG family transcriptional regulator [Aphanocapsa sp. GSE-SYN-MK-11-07L]
MKITTHLDQEHAQKLTQIQQQTNQDIAGAIQTAIDAYYQQLQPLHKNAIDIFEDVGFIACGKAETRDRPNGELR